MVTIWTTCYDNESHSILYSWVLYDSPLNRRLFPWTALTSRCLKWWSLGTDWSLKYCLDELRLQRVKQWYARHWITLLHFFRLTVRTWPGLFYYSFQNARLDPVLCQVTACRTTFQAHCITMCGSAYYRTFPSSRCSPIISPCHSLKRTTIARGLIELLAALSSVGVGKRKPLHPCSNCCVRILTPI
jgi:hypothetical protein